MTASLITDLEEVDSERFWYISEATLLGGLGVRAYIAINHTISV